MKNTIVLILISILFLILSGCNQSGFGIFYSIRTEEPLENRGLDDGITVTHIVAANGNYYAAAGVVYVLDAGDSAAEWVALDPPSAGYLCSSIASDGTDLFAVYFSSDATTSSLFEWNGTDWVAEDDPDLTGKRVESVVTANSKFFISVKEGPNSYDLYTDEATADEDFVIDADADVIGMPRPVIDIAYDGAEYWFTNKSDIYHGVADSWASDDQPSATGDCTGLFYGSIYADLYAAFDTGEVWINSGTWASSADTTGMDELTDFAEINRSGNNVLMVGSTAGYYETSTGSTFITPDPDNVLTTTLNYLNIELKDAIINTFLVDSGKIFAGTVGRGLWKNEDNVWALE